MVASEERKKEREREKEREKERKREREKERKKERNEEIEERKRERDDCNKTKNCEFSSIFLFYRCDDASVNLLLPRLLPPSSAPASPRP